MKTLNVYIGRHLLVTTCIAVFVLTFVMVSAHLIRGFELLARGVSLGILGRFLLYEMPNALTFTIPMSLLVASVLVFSRFSADNEIMAMRASGVSLWQIISPGLLLSIALSVFCFWLHTSLGPSWRYRAYLLRKGEGARNPMVVIEPGRFVEIPGHVIRVGKRDGDRLEDIHIYKLNDDGMVVTDITARRGRVTVDEVKRIIELDLDHACFTTFDPDADDKERQKTAPRVASERIVFPLDYGSEVDRRALSRRIKYMDMKMIFGRIYIDKERGVDTTSLYVELHSRMSMALSPFAFLLLGIPFGIRAKRSEASVGLLLCLVLAVGFHTFLMLADGLKHQSGLRPEVLVWLPNIIYQGGGLLALSALTKR